MEKSVQKSSHKFDCHACRLGVASDCIHWRQKNVHKRMAAIVKFCTTSNRIEIVMGHSLTFGDPVLLLALSNSPLVRSLYVNSTEFYRPNAVPVMAMMSIFTIQSRLISYFVRNHSIYPCPNKTGCPRQQNKTKKYERVNTNKYR